MEVNNISFAYDESKQILNGVTCEVPIGKITTIIGPNGCGKSTLLGIMSQNYVPKSGEVILDGKAIAQYSAKEFAQKLAVVHQQNEAPYDITVKKLTSYGRLPYKNLFSKQTEDDEAAIEWALKSTNLKTKENNTLQQLSGGERQRVWISMALAQKTSFLFLDEPTTFLDIYYQLEILELIRQLNEQFQLTIVMVLHDINQAIRYSDHIIAMKEGKIIAKGEPKEIISKELIKEIYGVDVIVREDEEIGLYLVPMGI